MKQSDSTLKYQEVVSHFQIELIGRVCVFFDRKGLEFVVKPLVYGNMALNDMPFDLRVEISSSDLHVYIYTDGGDANSPIGEIRMEREEYSSLDALREDFLQELEKLA